MLPHHYPVEFVKGGGMEKPVAILFIRLVEAQKLPNTDFFSKTDCYVRWSRFCVGSDIFARP